MRHPRSRLRLGPQSERSCLTGDDVVALVPAYATRSILDRRDIEDGAVRAARLRGAGW